MSLIRFEYRPPSILDRIRRRRWVTQSTVVLGLILVLIAAWVVYYCYQCRKRINVSQVEQMLAESGPPPGESLAWVLPVFAFPPYALGAWRAPPSAAWPQWTLVAVYGFLALFCAGLGAAILVNLGPFGRNPIPGEALAVMASIFLLPAALFAGVGRLVAFSPSVRDFWNHGRDASR